MAEVLSEEGTEATQMSYNNNFPVLPYRPRNGCSFWWLAGFPQYACHHWRQAWHPSSCILFPPHCQCCSAAIVRHLPALRRRPRQEGLEHSLSHDFGGLGYKLPMLPTSSIIDGIMLQRDVTVNSCRVLQQRKYVCNSW